VSGETSASVRSIRTRRPAAAAAAEAKVALLVAAQRQAAER